MYVGGWYIPPQNSTSNVYGTCLDVFNQIRQDVAAYLDITPYVSLCGDFNSRTGQLSDVEMYVNGRNSAVVEDLNDAVYHFTGTRADQPQDLKQRLSKDIKVNAYGKDLLELCKSSKLRIMNGFYNADQTNEYTCLNALGQSIVDYLICRESRFHTLQTSQISKKTSRVISHSP